MRRRRISHTLPVGLVAVLAATLVGQAIVTGQSPAPSADAAALSYVALGDSYPAADGCVDPCVSYPELYAELASQALGAPVRLTNLATIDSLETERLLPRILDDPAHREALAAADLITLGIGWNDFLSGCTLETWPGCIDEARTQTATSYAAILAAIVELRDGRPTVLRVTAPFDPVADWPANFQLAPDDPQGPEVTALVQGKLAELDAMLCDAAVAHGALCIDLRPLLNGPEGQDDAAEFLLADHVHLNAAGHALVAQALADLGFAPLQ